MYKIDRQRECGEEQDHSYDTENIVICERERYRQNTMNRKEKMEICITFISLKRVTRGKVIQIKTDTQMDR